MIENYMTENECRYDRQCADVFAACAWCGGEIYAGEEYTEWNGSILCCDDCILAWAKEECYTMTAPTGKTQLRHGKNRAIYEDEE